MIDIEEGCEIFVRIPMR